MQSKEDLAANLDSLFTDVRTEGRDSAARKAFDLAIERAVDAALAQGRDREEERRWLDYHLIPPGCHAVILDRYCGPAPEAKEPDPVEAVQRLQSESGLHNTSTAGQVEWLFEHWGAVYVEYVRWLEQHESTGGRRQYGAGQIPVQQTDAASSASRATAPAPERGERCEADTAALDWLEKQHGSQIRELIDPSGALNLLGTSIRWAVTAARAKGKP